MSEIAARLLTLASLHRLNDIDDASGRHISVELEELAAMTLTLEEQADDLRWTMFHEIEEAWEADRLAGHEWRIEGEGLRKRLKAADALAKAAEKHYYEDADLARALAAFREEADDE